MSRGIDHLVLPVHDLDGAKSGYERFGFTTTPKARHPFGTENVLVQLQGNFLELLGIGQPEIIKPPEPGALCFAHFNQTFLDKRQGMSMLVFESRDARADRAEFAAKGLTGYAPFDFSRQATLPGGEQVTVAFSLAFVTDPRMPDAAFFCCQQHAPQYFWKPAYQSHRNAAVVCSEVVMVAEEPPAFAGFFERLQGKGHVHARDGHLEVATSRGRITLVPPRSFAERFPGQPPTAPDKGAVFAAYRILTRNLETTEGLLRDNGVAYRSLADRLQIGPDEALGMVIEFAAE